MGQGTGKILRKGWKNIKNMDRRILRDKLSADKKAFATKQTDNEIQEFFINIYFNTPDFL